MTTIHPTAIVHPAAVLADNVEIGQHVIIEENVEIGEGTLVESANRICSGARIGMHCRIMHGAAISTAPQYPSGQGDDGLAIIGDHTTIREFATVNRGTADGGNTVIGSQSFLMAYCHIAHGCTIGNGVVIANGVQAGAGSSIHDFAIIGGMTGIDEGSRIGKYCMVSGSVHVTRDVPPYSLAGREPIEFEGLNVIGLRRRHFAADLIQAIDKAYALLYDTGSSPDASLGRLSLEFPGIPEIDEIATFVSASRNGLIPMHRA